MCVTMEPESSSQNAVHLIPVKQERDCGLTISATVKGESEVSYTFVIKVFSRVVRDHSLICHEGCNATIHDEQLKHLLELKVKRSYKQ